MQKCLALYDYVPRNSNELAIRKHEVITLHDASPSGWWKGEIDGRVGLFPGMQKFLEGRGREGKGTGRKTRKMGKEGE